MADSVEKEKEKEKEKKKKRVCCMCGDVGFFDKLFHCTKCLHRFQHSYCSNYYSEQGDPIEICDWCQCEAKSTRTGAKNISNLNGGSSKRSYRSEYSSGHQIKQQSNTASPAVDKGRNSGGSGGVPSPRPATRRYKLLKDVMC